MEFVIYGVDYHHKSGEFCPRKIAPYYFISCFRTDYVAEVDLVLVEGKAGDYMIVEPGVPVYHGPLPNAAKGFRNDWMYVAGEDLRALLEKYPLPLNRPFHIDGSFYLSSAIERIQKEQAFSFVGSEDKCDIIMTDSLIDLYRAYKKGERLSHAHKLEYARGQIMGDYKRQWSLYEMATLIGYSQSRFCALYKEHYGISPVNDLIGHRLEQAKRLMLYGNMRLSEISEAVGFSSIYYFSKCFKRKEGLSPTEYKRQGLS